MAYTRLTGDQRIKIQACINLRYNLKETADFVGVDRSTIHREIIRNCYYTNGPFQPITFEKSKTQCRLWKKFPYTCNKCSKRYYCNLIKRYYDCSKAEERFDLIKHNKNRHRKVNDEEISKINELISPLIKSNGQSLNHIYATNPELHDYCCERTLRRYLYKGLFDAKCHDLPRYVTYYHPKPRVYKSIKNPERLLNRTYSDYLRYTEENPDELIWQYDSVVGDINCKKAILTITFPKFRFQFGLLIDKGEPGAVLKVLNNIKKALRSRYSKIFQVNLSDNGPEFGRFYEIEKDMYDSGTNHVFYCSPYKSTDKASCERNHEFIRYIIPKGKNFDNLTQEEINLIFSHINSYVRVSNQNKTPYQLCIESFGTEFTQALGIQAIDPRNVCLKPSLIK